MALFGSRGGAPRRGASRRRRAADFDRWLDRAVSVAVITALAVSAAALALTRLL